MKLSAAYESPISCDAMENASRHTGASDIKHIRRDLSPCLLELPGGLFHAGHCLQLVGALLQNLPELFTGNGLCAVLRSNISHSEEEQVVTTPVFRLFGRVKESFIWYEDGFSCTCHLAR